MKDIVIIYFVRLKLILYFSIFYGGAFQIRQTTLHYYVNMKYLLQLRLIYMIWKICFKKY